MCHDKSDIVACNARGLFGRTVHEWPSRTSGNLAASAKTGRANFCENSTRNIVRALCLVERIWYATGPARVAEGRACIHCGHTAVGAGSGVLTACVWRTQQTRGDMAGLQVTFVGELFYTGLGVGGGPVYPPAGGGGQPPGIWGPPGPWPSPPIHLPPSGGGGQPPTVSPPIYYPPQIWPTPPSGGGGQPPGIWGPPGPWPSPPIHLPPSGGGSPPGIWGPPGPWPSPPIHLPPGGGGQPPGGGGQPPQGPPGGEGHWAYSPVYGWVWVPSGSGGKPQPPSTGGEVPPEGGEAPPDPNAPTPTPH